MAVFSAQAQPGGGFPANMGGGIGQGGNNAKDTTFKNSMDSVRTIYGAYTTSYFLESDWLEGRKNRRSVDTLLYGMHRYNYAAQTRHRTQNLGTLASPSAPIFYQQPDQIGIRAGFHALDDVLLKPSEMAYFNTKSPYTSWKYVQSGGGRSYLDIAFARNINSRANMGFVYHRVINRMVVGTRAESGQFRQADYQHIVVHGNYSDKADRYRFLGYFMAYRNRLQETGGLEYSATISNIDTLFELSDGLLRNRLGTTAHGLQQAESLRIYQDYRLAGKDSSLALSLFHQVEWTKQRNSFEDTKSAADATFYPFHYYNNDTTQFRFVFQRIDTRMGIKISNKSLFIAAYYRIRAQRASQEVQYGRGGTLEYDTPLEQLVGASGVWEVPKIGKLRFQAEHVLLKDYRLRGLLDLPWAEVNFSQTLYSPSLLERKHIGNSFIWGRSNFVKTFANELGGTLKLGNSRWQFRPNLVLGNVSKLVYFGTDAKPTQYNGGVSYWRGGFETKWHIGKWYWELEGFYTRNTNEAVLPVPHFFANSMIYYQGLWVKGLFPIQIGIDAHWHSAYKANMYMPVTQQFYRQQQFLVGNYPFIELFANAQVRTVRLFVKFTNALQGFPKKGYFLTPGYMAQPRQLEFGLNWKFYD